MEIPTAQTRGKAPSPGSLLDPTSPRTRGGVSRAVVPRSSSRELPGRAVLGVLEHHAHGEELVADAVGLGEVLRLAGSGARRNQGFDTGSVDALCLALALRPPGCAVVEK